MADTGTKKRRVHVDEPIEAPVFVPPVKREQPAELPTWLDPNKVTAPVRENEYVRVGGN